MKMSKKIENCQNVLTPLELIMEFPDDGLNDERKEEILEGKILAKMNALVGIYELYEILKSLNLERGEKLAEFKAMIIELFDLDYSSNDGMTRLSEKINTYFEDLKMNLMENIFDENKPNFQKINSCKTKEEFDNIFLPSLNEIFVSIGDIVGDIEVIKNTEDEDEKKILKIQIINRMSTLFRARSLDPDILKGPSQGIDEGGRTPFFTNSEEARRFLDLMYRDYKVSDRDYEQGCITAMIIDLDSILKNSDKMVNLSEKLNKVKEFISPMFYDKLSENIRSEVEECNRLKEAKDTSFWVRFKEGFLRIFNYKKTFENEILLKNEEIIMKLEKLKGLQNIINAGIERRDTDWEIENIKNAIHKDMIDYYDNQRERLNSMGLLGRMFYRLTNRFKTPEAKIRELEEKVENLLQQNPELQERPEVIEHSPLSQRRANRPSLEAEPGAPRQEEPRQTLSSSSNEVPGQAPPELRGPGGRE